MNTRIVDIYKLEPVGSHLSVKVIGIVVYYTADDTTVFYPQYRNLDPLSSLYHNVLLYGQKVT
jgi:hypothetical protein